MLRKLIEFEINCNLKQTKTKEMRILSTLFKN